MNEEMEEFSIEVSSDLDYEKMVVNLNFGNNQIAILNCDKGVNKVEIKILDQYEDRVIWSLDFQSFITALNLANEKLKQSNN